MHIPCVLLEFNSFLTPLVAMASSHAAPEWEQHLACVGMDAVVDTGAVVDSEWALIKEWCIARGKASMRSLKFKNDDAYRTWWAEQFGQSSQARVGQV